MHRLLLAFLLMCPCGFAAIESPRVCPGMRPLLADRYDKTLFPDYGAQWHYSMPFVEAVQWYVEDFRGSYIRMPELRDVGRGSFGVRHAPNRCGWNMTLKPGFHPGQFTRRRAKHYSDRVVVMDPTAGNFTGLRAAFGSKTLCLDSDQCPFRYYLSSGNASEGTRDECKTCDESCVTCDGPGSHFGKGGCTKCGIVYLKELDDGKYRETCMAHRQSCFLGGSCAPRDFIPAYELSKDLPVVALRGP